VATEDSIGEVSTMMRIPTDHSTGRRWRVAVAVDGSAGAAEAVEWTTRLASATGAVVVAVHALTPPLLDVGYGPWGMGVPPLPDEPTSWRVEADRVEETLVRDWCRPLREAGVTFRATVIQGGAPQLLSYVSSIGSDLLVVGSRGLGGFKELVLGSFSHHAVHHASIPVVVVPGGVPMTEREPARTERSLVAHA
jgi:nucleotide-binding universal stress UspA family protein